MFLQSPRDKNFHLSIFVLAENVGILKEIIGMSKSLKEADVVLEIVKAEAEK